MILLTGGRGVPHTPPRADTPKTPPEQTPPWEQTPPQEQTPPSRHPPEQTPPGSRPPGADTPPAKHAVRYGQRAGGTHPTGMQSCDNCYHKSLEKIDHLPNIHFNEHMSRKINENCLLSLFLLQIMKAEQLQQRQHDVCFGGEGGGVLGHALFYSLKINLV